MVVVRCETDVCVIHKGVADKRQDFARQGSCQFCHVSSGRHALQQDRAHHGPDEGAHSVALQHSLDGQVAFVHVGLATVGFLREAISCHDGVHSILEGGEQ